MFCPKYGRFIVSPEEKCLICGDIIKKNSRKTKTKNKTNKQKQNTKTKKIKSKKKKSKSNKSKKKYNWKNRSLGGKTRIHNARSFFEFEVLGNTYSSYYF